MSFENPYILFLLLLAFPITLAWKIAVKKRAIKIRKFTEIIFDDKLHLGNHEGLRKAHFILFLMGILFLILACSGPSYAGGKEKVKISGIDIIIALDVSNSMKAQDIVPNRIECAKLALQQLLTTMGTDRIGLVVFAGQAYTCLPLTNDQAAASMLLQSITPEMISMQGTAIGSALDNALASFMKVEKDRGKAIIVISDGENHEGDAVKAARRAADKGVIVCTIGIGSTEGTTIPELNNKGILINNKKDENGKVIISKLDEVTLKEIAKEGQGIYVRAAKSDLGIGAIYNLLKDLNKTTKDAWRTTHLTPLFQWFLLASILLFLIEGLLSEGKRNTTNNNYL
jgi:Ca-activated chloride channel homolog